MGSENHAKENNVRCEKKHAVQRNYIYMFVKFDESEIFVSHICQRIFALSILKDVNCSENFRAVRFVCHFPFIFFFTNKEVAH